MIETTRSTMWHLGCACRGQACTSNDPDLADVKRRTRLLLEYVSIAGPSGCGKSTLLSILGLLDAPTAGESMLNGTPVAQLSVLDRARIRNQEVDFIFQSFNAEVWR
jgi:predicted ABC-type transport system involved in lysophospholipase L1 biosynthesis ATPase subunit